MFKHPDQRKFETRHFAFRYPGTILQNVQRLGEMIAVHRVRSSLLGIARLDLLKKPL